MAVEMTIVTPMLLLLLLGIFDFGRLTVVSMEVEHATQAAASYAFIYYINHNSLPTITAIQAITESQSLPITVTFTFDTTRPTAPWTGCPNGTQVVATTSACTAGSGQYVSIVGSASTAHLPLGTWGAAFPTTLSTTVVMRLQ